MKQHGVYYVTGGLRSGKSLICTRKIQEFLVEGRKVATNFDLRLENMLGSKRKDVTCLRIPDHPTVDDLNAIGQGYDHGDPEHYDESQFGLIVLDELGTWMNSRNWQDKGRKAVIDWLLHSGKRRWILMLIIQDLELLDNQAAKATANQYVVRCKRLGSYSIPILSPIFQFFFDRPLKLPDGHVATVRNGPDKRDPVAERWWYRGSDLYKAYNTRQEFMSRDHSDAVMLCSYLWPWHLKGRYEIVKDWAYWRDWLNSNGYAIALALVPISGLLLVTLPITAFAVYKSVGLSQTVSELKRQVAFVKSSVPVVPKPVIVSKKDKDRLDCSVLDQFSSYRITGHIKKPSGQVYLLSSNQGSMMSTKLVSLGFGVTSVSRCLITVSKGQCKQEITCDLPDSRGAGVTAGGAGTAQAVELQNNQS